MNLYVIGNGFDKHYQLETSYSNFKEFLYNTGFSGLVAKADSFFYEHGCAPEEIENWASFEDMLEKFNELDADELFDYAMDNAETDDERADFFDSPSWNVDFYFDYIKVLKEQFIIWIRSIDNHITKDAYFNPSNSDLILNFNYTKTIEDNFPELKATILHIHGAVDEGEIVVGHNSYVSPSLFQTYWDEDTDFRSGKAMDAVDDLLKFASKEYYKDSSKIMELYRNFFEKITHCDKVIFMGFSCGNQDILYVQNILKKAKKIIFYYYQNDTSSLYRIKELAKNYSVDIIPVKW